MAVNREELLEYYNRDYEIDYDRADLSGEARIVRALEYIAYQLGQINRKMGESDKTMDGGEF